MSDVSDAPSATPNLDVPDGHVHDDDGPIYAMRRSVYYVYDNRCIPRRHDVGYVTLPRCNIYDIYDMYDFFDVGMT